MKWENYLVFCMNEICDKYEGHSSGGITNIHVSGGMSHEFLLLNLTLIVSPISPVFVFGSYRTWECLAWS